MLSALSLRRWQPLVVQAAELVFDHLLRRPIRGLMELAAGVTQAGLPLLHAARQAVVDAVDAQLTSADTHAIQQGGERIKAGLALLAWPLLIFTTVLCWRAPFAVQALLLLVSLSLPLG